MKKELDNYLRVDFNDIFWNIIVENTGQKNGKKEDSEPIIQLKWGWTASLTDEEIKELSESNDNPTGFNSVKILKSQAMILRDDLDDMISSMNAELFD